jgi:hypothetical protein
MKTSNDLASTDVTVADLLYMLRLALIEIRAAKDIEIATRLADVFHQVPSFAVGKSDDQSGRELYAKVLARAKRRGVSKYIEKLRLEVQRR